MSSADIEEVCAIKNYVDVYQIVWTDVANRQYKLTENPIKRATLRIFREISPFHINRLALIKCRDWFYPLEAGKTIIYRCHEYKEQKCHCYLFPDVNNPDAYAIVFLQFEDEGHWRRFETALSIYAQIEDSPLWWKAIPDDLTGVRIVESLEYFSKTDEGYAEKIARGLVTGAECINTGITKGTQYANSFIQNKAEQYKANAPPPVEPKQIDPRVINGLKGMRIAASTACTVTGACVSVVAKGTQALGKHLAPHVRKHGTKLVSSVSGQNEQDSSKTVDNILTIAAGGLQGFSTLYTGVTENAKVLGKTVANEASEVVQKKYGNDAGIATRETLYAAGNAALTVQNVKDLGPKAIATRAATQTGKTLLELEKEKSEKEKSNEVEDNINNERRG